MKESLLKVDDLFLPITSSGCIHKIFGMHLQKGLIYLCTKTFLPTVLYFGNYNPVPNGQMIPWLALKHTSKYNSRGMNDTKYWRLVIVEYLQPNKLKKKSNFDPIYYVSCFFFCWRAIYENACKFLHEGTRSGQSSF